VTWVFIFQKRGKNLKHLKPTYLFKLFKQDKAKDFFFEDAIIQKKIDHIMAKEVYL
jgi:hypothetical protein